MTGSGGHPVRRDISASQRLSRHTGSFAFADDDSEYEMRCLNL